MLMPGQGLHYVGMGRSLAKASPAAAAVFAEADEVLGFPLAELCWQGPEEALTLTEHAQPAIVAHAIAALRAMQERGNFLFDAVVGHSLGEWTALVAAGALSLAEALSLVRLRGRFMQQAVPAGQGAMSVVMGLEHDVVQRLCAVALEQCPGRVVALAARNGRTQIAVSGHADAVAWVENLARARGAIGVTTLTVSAPFHCALMAPAAEEMRLALAGVQWSAPTATVWSTVTGAPILDPAWIPDLLLRQFTEPVLWQPALEAMAAAGTERAYALGPARSLKGMVRRIVRSLQVHVVDEAAALPG